MLPSAADTLVPVTAGRVEVRLRGMQVSVLQTASPAMQQPAAHPAPSLQLFGCDSQVITCPCASKWQAAWTATAASHVQKVFLQQTEMDQAATATWPCIPMSFFFCSDAAFSQCLCGCSTLSPLQTS